MLRQIGSQCLGVFSPYSVGSGEVALAVVSGLSMSVVVFERGAGVTLAAVSAMLGFMMTLVTVIDRRLFLIPDLLSLPAAALGFAVAFLVGPEAGAPNLFNHALAALVAAGMFYAVRALYTHWRGIEGMGLGDVKLAAAAGAWVGLDRLGATLLLACASALVAVLVRRLSGQRVAPTLALPFGSFIAPSIALVWLAGVWSS
jgi:leader peptidase (prepilin peptidase) / N-methyltransferase